MSQHLIPERASGAPQNRHSDPQSGLQSAAPPVFQLQSGPPAPAGPPPSIKDVKVKLGGRKVTLDKDMGPGEVAQTYLADKSQFVALRKANPKAKTNDFGAYPKGSMLTLPTHQVLVKDILENDKLADHQLKVLAPDLNATVLQRYLLSLPKEKRHAALPKIQRIIFMASTGSTPKELANAQVDHWKLASKKEKKSVGKHLRNQIEQEGYGGRFPIHWYQKPELEREALGLKFLQAKAALLKSKEPQVKAVLAQMHAHKGDIVWAPEKCEESNAFAYTQNDWKLYVGTEWLEAYLQNPKKVYANLVHELGGHNEYGKTLLKEVTDQAMGKLDKKDKDEVANSKKSADSLFAYLETELWAELREHAVDDEHNSTDRPFGGTNGQRSNVKDILKKMKVYLAPVLAKGLVTSLYRRAEMDDRIQATTTAAFRAAIKDVFGMKL